MPILVWWQIMPIDAGFAVSPPTHPGFAMSDRPHASRQNPFPIPSRRRQASEIVRMSRLLDIHGICQR